MNFYKRANYYGQQYYTPAANLVLTSSLHLVMTVESSSITGNQALAHTQSGLRWSSSLNTNSCVERIKSTKEEVIVYSTVGKWSISTN